MDFRTHLFHPQPLKRDVDEAVVLLGVTINALQDSQVFQFIFGG